MSGFDDIFISLFFGEGMWLGLLLFIGICIGLMKQWRWSGVIILPIIIMMEVEYVDRLVDDQNMGWPITVLLIFALFTALNTLYGWTNK